MGSVRDKNLVREGGDLLFELRDDGVLGGEIALSNLQPAANHMDLLLRGIEVPSYFLGSLGVGLEVGVEDASLTSRVLYVTLEALYSLLEFLDTLMSFGKFLAELAATLSTFFGAAIVDSFRNDFISHKKAPSGDR